MVQEIRVGVITKTHGLKGEVKVYATTDSPYRFDEITTVLLDAGRGKKEFEVENVRYFKGTVILKLKGVEDINAAELLKGKDLFVHREDAAPLEEGEYYIADIIGLTVEDENGIILGKVKDVLETGANDVYVVQRPGAKDLLLPAIKQCILGIDLEKEIMTVHVMDGLLEL